MPHSATFIIAVAALGCLATQSLAQQALWGSPEDSTVKFITAIEEKWANSSCSAQPELKSVIADDFRGTATDGQRYEKPEAIAVDPKTFARECRLDDVKVRFFGDSVAIAYGSESRVRKDTDGSETKRCQVWTDTWIRRSGQWQIVAAQDTVIPCKP